MPPRVHRISLRCHHKENILPEETFSFSEVCDLIVSKLFDFSGEDLAELYNKISDDNSVEYQGDSIFIVKNASPEDALS